MALQVFEHPLIDGGEGNDVLQANGNDILIGGAGNDTSGDDVWLYATTAASGWTSIAVFNNVPAAVFDAGIENGTMVTLIGTDIGM